MPPPERREGFGFAWWSICRSSNCGGTARSIPDACTIRLEGDLHDRPLLARVGAHVQTSAVPQETDQGVEGLFSGTGAPRVGAVHREQRVEQEVRVDPRLHRPQITLEQGALGGERRHAYPMQLPGGAPPGFEHRVQRDQHQRPRSGAGKTTGDAMKLAGVHHRFSLLDRQAERPDQELSHRFHQHCPRNGRYEHRDRHPRRLAENAGKPVLGGDDAEHRDQADYKARDDFADQGAVMRCGIDCELEQRAAEGNRRAERQNDAQVALAEPAEPSAARRAVCNGASCRKDAAHDRPSPRVHGSLMVATTPRGELASKRSVARSSYCAASRARMLASPTPEPDAAANPCPVSATESTSVSPSRAAARRIAPPSASGPMPCLIAFSTRVASIIDGTRASSSGAGTSIELSSRAPMRIFCTPRKAETSSISSARETSWSRILGSAARRYRASWASMARPAPASLWHRRRTLERVLNRKCGSICACSRHSRVSSCCFSRLARCSSAELASSRTARVCR